MPPKARLGIRRAATIGRPEEQCVFDCRRVARVASSSAGAIVRHTTAAPRP
jgi:hypothetical protein